MDYPVSHVRTPEVRCVVHPHEIRPKTSNTLWYCNVHAFRFQTAGRSPITLYTPAIPLFSGHIVSMLLSMGQNHGGGVALASGSSPAQLLSGPPRGE